MLTLRQAMEHALAAYGRGAMADAERMCRLVADGHPDFAPALHLLGIICGRTGRAAESIELLSKAVAAEPRNPEAQHHLGVAQSALKRYDDALDSYRRALALQPDYTDAHFNQGVALMALDRRAEALASFERALALRPDFTPAHLQRAIVLSQLGRHADALAASEQALAIAPRSPEALVARGKALRDLHRPAEALESNDQAIALDAGIAEAWNNRGNALADLGEIARAIESYDRAIALRPDYADAHFNLALCTLLDGDLARGFAEYEWRPRPPRQRVPGAAPWHGDEDLAGRTILLYAEQGLGDTLHFCRYASRVAAMGATVLLEVQPALRSLLARMDGAAQVVTPGHAPEGIDYQCPLLSLPRVFGTTLGDMPSSVPYLTSDPERVATWQARLGDPSKPRVGIVWSGNAAQARDHLRSMSLTDMLPLVDNRAEYVSLQRDLRAEDASVLASHPEVRHFGDALRDFDDTAALLACVDRVVTVDTSVAHLAGAMGKQVFILLAFHADWRWLRGREDCPWYPTARLLRQTAPGDWAGVVRRARDELAP